MSSHTSVGHTNFYMQVGLFTCGTLVYYKDTTICIAGWDQVEEIQGYIHLGMQMPTICKPIWILPKIQAGFEGGREIVCCNCRG